MNIKQQIEQDTEEVEKITRVIDSYETNIKNLTFTIRSREDAMNVLMKLREAYQESIAKQQDIIDKKDARFTHYTQTGRFPE